MSGVKEGSLAAASKAIFALAVGTFAIGTGEFAAMGLLPEMAQGVQATIPRTGEAISAYALGVVVGAPLIAVFGATFSRRTLLAVLMGWFAVTNCLGTLAATLGMLDLARFVTGLPHGAFMGVAALVAAGLVDRGYRGRAVGRVFSGLTIANVVGAPFATYAGSYFGWRLSYVLIGLVGAVCCLMVMAWLPYDPPNKARSALSELQAFTRKQVWYVMGTVAVGCGGMFCVYTYFSVTLQDVTGVPVWGVPLFQAVWGVGMCTGAWAGGHLMDKSLKWTAIGAFVWNALALGLFSLVATNMWLTALAVFMLGGGIAVGPAMQVRLMDVAADAQTLAASMNHAAFNLANALGAWLGGLVLTAGFGAAATGWAGMVLSVIGLVLFVLSLAAERRDNNRAAALAG
ncbi:MFS transporter [Acetobacter suratthaniensis]|uniref:MFS transporter n=1 Tax=Acetobacter suratthaniensis TaxID=1502841 RepID=A0ABS3LK73_9PROT|nr:MFS transporter [Acetobacter suratthaniensis]MBO1327940.1 MFS transporter [Acetobacter suratthaniensis]MCX2565880.1 MFS transporter [Acetobacter suratthaniensis]